MISSRELQFNVKRKLNRYNSSYSQHITPEYVDAYLNEALQLWFENRAILIDTNPRVENDLRQLVKTKESLECIEEDTKCCVFPIPINFYKPLRIEAIVCREECGNRDMLVRPIQSQKINESTILDPFSIPSFEFKETFYNLGEKGIYIFHNKLFTFKKVFIDYLQKHPKLYTPSLTPENCYYDPDGLKISTDSNLLLDSTYPARQIEDVTVMLILRDINDTPELQTQIQKALQLENYYKTDLLT